MSTGQESLMCPLNLKPNITKTICSNSQREKPPWKTRSTSTRMKNSTLSKSTRVNPPVLAAEWFEEPSLLFANGRKHCDPKVGINLYGPRSYGSARHRNEVHFGFIGTGETVNA